MNVRRVLVYGMTSNTGGIEMYIIRLFRYIEKSKLIFDFIIENESIPFEDEVRASGSIIYQVPQKSKHPFRHIRAMYNILRQHPEYQIIYFNILNANAAFSLLPYLRKKRRIIIHSHNTGDSRMFTHRIARPFLSRMADVMLACSQSAAEFMFGNLTDEGRAVVIKNPVDTTAFKFDKVKRTQTRLELELETAHIVLHVGRISEQKNPLFLLDVIKKAIDHNPSVVLLYVGTGEMEEQVKSYAVQLGITDRIRFLGLRNDIPALMCAADVFLLPSIYEGLGIVLIEAQASGLRCVCSEAIQPEARLLPGNIYLPLDAPLAQWVEAICMDFTNQDREVAAERVSSLGFGSDSEYEKILALITGGLT